LNGGCDPSTLWLLLPFDYTQGKLPTLRVKAMIRELEIRELERKKEKGRLLCAPPFAILLRRRLRRNQLRRAGRATANSGQAFFAGGRLLLLKFTAPVVDSNFAPIYL